MPRGFIDDFLNAKPWIPDAMKNEEKKKPEKVLKKRNINVPPPEFMPLVGEKMPDNNPPPKNPPKEERDDLVMYGLKRNALNDIIDMLPMNKLRQAYTVQELKVYLEIAEKLGRFDDSLQIFQAINIQNDEDLKRGEKLILKPKPKKGKNKIRKPRKAQEKESCTLWFTGENRPVRIVKFERNGLLDLFLGKVINYNLSCQMEDSKKKTRIHTSEIRVKLPQGIFVYADEVLHFIGGATPNARKERVEELLNKIYEVDDAFIYKKRKRKKGGKKAKEPNNHDKALGLLMKQ